VGSDRVTELGDKKNAASNIFKRNVFDNECEKLINLHKTLEDTCEKCFL
jgi:hypothetical protein